MRTLRRVRRAMRSMRAPANPAVANSSAAPSRMRALEVDSLFAAGANRRMLLNEGEDATKTGGAAARGAAHPALARPRVGDGDDGGRRARPIGDRGSAGAE